MTSKLFGLISGVLMTVFLVGCYSEPKPPKEFSVYIHCIDNGKMRVRDVQYPELIKQCVEAQVKLYESARIANESKK